MPLHLQPQPLRSDDYPDGLPNLSEKEQARVDSANASYKATADILLLLIGWNFSVSIENPAKSLFWKTSWIQKLLQRFHDGHDTFLDHCMHGGARDKASRFWSYNPRRPSENMLESLALKCDGSHTHTNLGSHLLWMVWSHFPQRKKRHIQPRCASGWHQSSYTGQGLETLRDPKIWWSKQQQILTQANDSCSPANPGPRPSCSRCRSLVILWQWPSPSIAMICIQS